MRACVRTCKLRSEKHCPQENNHQISSVEEHPPFSRQMHTCFDGYLGRTGSQTILSMLHRRQPCPSAHAPTHRASTCTASRWPLLRRSSGIVFWTVWTFFYLCYRDAAITLTPTTMSPRTSSGAASALAEMSSQPLQGAS